MCKLVSSLFGLLGRNETPARAGDEGKPVEPEVKQVQYLTPYHMGKIREHKTVYQWACRKVGMWPWQGLAAVHYRESEFSRKGEEPHAGPFSIDPPGAGIQADLIHSHVKRICDLYGEAYMDLDESFAVAALVAAHKLSRDAQAALPGVRCDDARYIAAGLWRYNGASRFHVPPGVRPDDPDQWLNRSHEWSSYVSNDPKRGKQLMLKGTLPDADGDGEDEKINRPDPRPGAMVVYLEILARDAELS